jgi:hypothetical protein
MEELQRNAFASPRPGWQINTFVRLKGHWPHLRLGSGTARHAYSIAGMAVVGSFGKSTVVRAVAVALDRNIHRSILSSAKNSVAGVMFRIRPAN